MQALSLVEWNFLSEGYWLESISSPIKTDRTSTVWSVILFNHSCAFQLDIHCDIKIYFGIYAIPFVHDILV